MTCPACRRDNPDEARFCMYCATPLANRAAPAAYTPKHLADKILTSRAALEGERKQVTVLFADVKGSMDLQEDLDPEEWHRIMDRFFAIMTDGVHRFEGTINQYTGDGIMALFGAPLAHEDHAQRAGYAALHLRDELHRYADELRRTRSLSFSVRMGLNSGEVVVGKIGDDLRMDYTAQGFTVGLAARMEQLADPGSTYLTEHTATLVTGFFLLRPLGLFTVKGVRDPLHVYALDGVGPLRTRFEASRARGFSRFVGREAEMAMIDASCTRALEGHGQVVGIVAEPGVGKSRLCYEFLQTQRLRGIAVHEARCVAHGRMSPFLPLLELLRSYFGITERDNDEEARRKVAGTVLLLEPQLTESLPLLLDFLGVPDLDRPPPRLEAGTRQRHLFALLATLVQVYSRRHPTVLLIEDLQWIDGASAEFLASLIDIIPRTRTLLLLNFRAEYRARWLSDGGAAVAPYCQILALAPLGEAATTELLTDLLGRDPALSGLAQHIRERTAGNPFFIEEVVQALLDQGILSRGSAAAPDGPLPAGPHGAAPREAPRLTRAVTEIQIPASVQAVLTARIDRLPELEKQVLQTAAVIGKEFGEPVLWQVAEAGVRAPVTKRELDAALRALTQGQFLYEQTSYPELVYVFKHPLTQEVAYRSQLAERRAQIHAAVAAALATLYPDKAGERAALIAHHWEAAGGILDAARWSRRAAEWIRTGSLTEAYRHWRNVRTLVGRIDATSETTQLALEACVRLLELGWRVGISADDATEIVKHGQALAMQRGDPRAMTQLISAYAVIRSHVGGADEFVEHSTLALRVAESTGDAGLQLASRTRLVIALGAAGNLRTALELVEAAVAAPAADLDLGAAMLGYSPYVRLLRERGKLLIDLGRLDEGARELARAAQLARQRDDLEILGFTHSEYATLARVKGDADTALAHARDGMRIAERLGSPLFRAWACLSFGHAHILGARWSEARGALEEALGIARAGGAGVETEALSLAWLAAAHLGLGAMPRAQELAREALGAAERRRTRLAECVAHIGWARVLLRTDPTQQHAAIEAALARALELVEVTGARSNEPFIRVEMARLAGALGDQRRRHMELAEAHRLFLQMGASARATRVARELGDHLV